MPNFQYYWLSLSKDVQKEVIIPNDLREIIKLGKTVRRLADPNYPVYAFSDNLIAHEFRLVRRANLLPIDDQIKQKIIRMIWLHDAPEAFSKSTRDFTSVEKEKNSGLANRINNDEFLVANKIFRKPDLELYIEYENSKEAIKNGKNNEFVTFTGLITRILDSIDGNMSFHYFLTKWIRSKDYKLSELPPDEALTYTFRYTKTTKENLQKLDLKEEEFSLLSGLLEEQIEYVNAVWDKMDVDKIPEIVLNDLNT